MSEDVNRVFPARLRALRSGGRIWEYGSPIQREGFRDDARIRRVSVQPRAYYVSVVTPPPLFSVSPPVADTGQNTVQHSRKAVITIA
jgi:hypothetical protein